MHSTSQGDHPFDKSVLGSGHQTHGLGQKPVQGSEGETEVQLLRSWKHYTVRGEGEEFQGGARWDSSPADGLAAVLESPGEWHEVQLLSLLLIPQRPQGTSSLSHRVMLLHWVLPGQHREVQAGVGIAVESLEVKGEGAAPRTLGTLAVCK